MRRSGTALMTAILVISTAGPVAAKLYKYRDNAGNLHVVDAYEKVPREYQNQVSPDGEKTRRNEYRIQQSEPLATDSGLQSSPTTQAPPSSRERCQQDAVQLRQKIGALEKQADQWTRDELMRNCPAESRTDDNDCIVVAPAGEMKAMVNSMLVETEKKNPHRKTIETEQLRLKKLEASCR